MRPTLYVLFIFTLDVTTNLCGKKLEKIIFVINYRYPILNNNTHKNKRIFERYNAYILKFQHFLVFANYYLSSIKVEFSSKFYFCLFLIYYYIIRFSLLYYKILLYYYYIIRFSLFLISFSIF